MKTTTTTERRSGKKAQKATTAHSFRGLTLTPSQQHYLSLAVLLMAVLSVYANALQNGFVFDDINHIVKNTILREASNIPRILIASYRPIRDLSHVLDFAIWGENAFGFHLTNIIIHAVNTLLVFFLVRHVIGLALPSVLAALIFAVHPLQTDAVTYISGRRDILFSLFYLSSFLCYLRYRRGGKKRYFGLFLGFWALSLMSKEMAASLPIFIFAWNFCESWPGGGSPYWRRLLLAARSALARDKWLYLAVALLVPAYAYYMVFIKGGSTRVVAGGFNYWGGSFYTNMLTAFRVHAWYLKQLVFPTPIVQYYGAFDIATTLSDWRVIVSLVVVMAVFAAGLLLLDRDRRVSFAIFSYFVLLLPVSHIIPHHELLADHYLYLPLMSFGLLVGLVAHTAATRGRAKIVYGVVGAAVLTFAIMTVARNPIYKDNFTLWQENYREVPNSIRAAYSLAGLYANSYPQKAIDLYKKCVELDPSYSPAYVSLAVILQSKEKAREAEQIIRRGLALPDSQVISPANPHPREFRSELTTALALARGNQGDNQDAERLLWEAISINPTNHQPYTLLASFYRTRDRNKEFDVLNRQLAVNPGSTQALEDVSNLLIEQKRFDEAIPYLERLLALNPNGFFPNFNLGHIYRSKNECGRARSFFLASQVGAATAEEVKAVKDAFTALDYSCKE